MAILTKINENILNKTFTKYTSDKRIPSAVSGLIQDGKLIYVYSHGLGSYKLEPQKLQFRIASMTKCFASSIILKLRDEHKIKLDDTVAKHVPELSSTPWDKITIYQLLTMQSGLLTDDPWADRLLDMTDDEFLEILSQPLFFIPQSSYFSYSNLGYMILGRIISNIRGVSALTVISEELLKPLKMNSTEWNPTKTYLNGNKFLNDVYIEEKFYSVKSDSAVFGGLWSTLEDLTIWIDFMQNSNKYNDILSAESRKELQTEQIAISNLSPDLNEPTSYCYGMCLYQSNNLELAGHSGGLPGYGSHFRWTVSNDFKMGIIFMCNLTYHTGSEICRYALQLIIKNINEAQCKVPDIIASRAKEFLNYFLDISSVKTELVFASNFFEDCPKENFQKTIIDIKNKYNIADKKDFLILPDLDLGYRIILSNIELCYISLSPGENARIQKVNWLAK